MEAYGNHIQLRQQRHYVQHYFLPRREREREWKRSIDEREDLLDIDKQHRLPMLINRLVCLFPEENNRSLIRPIRVGSSYFITPLCTEYNHYGRWIRIRMYSRTISSIECKCTRCHTGIFRSIV